MTETRMGPEEMELFLHSQVVAVKGPIGLRMPPFLQGAALWGSISDSAAGGIGRHVLCRDVQVPGLEVSRNQVRGRTLQQVAQLARGGSPLLKCTEHGFCVQKGKDPSSMMARRAGQPLE